MKKIFLILIFYIYTDAYSQVTRVIYKSGIYGQDLNDIKLDGEKFKNLSQDQITVLKTFFKNQSKIDYELVYDKNCSVFKKVNVLLSDKESVIKEMNILNDDIYFKNILTKEKKYITNLDKKYSVTVPFLEYKWEITTESKIVSGYKCYKAKTSKVDLYNPFKKSKLTLYPVVWFTPDIPSSFGPQGLDGLPGLVLEASLNGKKYLYATKIEINNKEIATIDKI